MSYKIKSSLYLTSLILVTVLYYSNEKANKVQESDLAKNTIENVSTNETLN